MKHWTGRAIRRGVRASVTAVVTAVVAVGLFGGLAGHGPAAAWGQASNKPKKPTAVATPVVPAFEGFQPAMIDKVAADAVLVAAWEGYQSPGSGYQGSKAFKVFNDLGLGKSWGGQLAALAKLGEAAGGGAGGGGAAGRRASGGKAAAATPGGVLGRPGIAWVRVVEKKIELTVMLDAGDDADAVVSAFEGVMSRLEGAGEDAEPAAAAPGKKKTGGAARAGSNRNPNLKFSREGSILTLRQVWDDAFPALGAAPTEGSSGSGEEEKPKKKPGGALKGILADEDFADAMKRVKGKPLAMFWMKPSLAYSPLVAETDIANRLAEAGLTNARYVLATGMFEKGGDWESELFVASAGGDERKGLVKSLLPTRKVSTSLLQRVPGDSTYFEAFRLDLREVFAGLADAFGDDPMGRLLAEKKLEDFNDKTPNTVELRINHWGALAEQNLRGAILAMGPDYIAFNVKTPSAPGGESLVVLNRLVDTEKFRTVTSAAARWLDQVTVDGNQGHWKYTTEQRRALTVNVLELEYPKGTTRPANAPDRRICWAVRDTLMAFGQDVDAIATAMTGSTSTIGGALGVGGSAATPAATRGSQTAMVESVVENGRVKKIQTELGAPENSAVSWVDLGALWPGWHAKLTAGATLADATGLAPGVKLAGLVPNKEKFGELLSPAISASWTDNDGYRFKSRSPMPLIDLAGPQNELGTWITGLMQTALRTNPTPLWEEKKKNR